METTPAPDRYLVISYLALRKWVGAIGVLLPLVLWLGALWFFDTGLQDSISGYYHTGMRDVFVGSMWAIGVFLLAYQFGPWHNWAGNFAGLCAVVLALFPTARVKGEGGWQDDVHLYASIGFLLTLAFFALVLFPRSSSDGNPHRAADVIYYVCGTVMLAALIAALLDVGVSVFVCETVAVVAFGVSWFVKGTTLADGRPPKPVAAALVRVPA